MPQPPDVWPDPESCASFSEWLKALTGKKYGVTQRVVAEVAATTPQAVTKWLKGGAIEAERLVRLAEWSGFSYQSLRRLVDEPKLGVFGSRISEDPAPYRLSSLLAGHDELLAIYQKLTADNRQQLLGMAKALKSKQKKRK